MTREQLDAIDAKARVAYHWPSAGQSEADREVIRSVATLLAEVERLTAEVESKTGQNVALIGQNGRLQLEVERLRDAHALAVQVSGELCEKCGWAMKFPEEPCRCELLDGTERQALLSEIGRLLDEVERLTADPLPAAAWVREVQQASFQRGVAAMREAALAVANKRATLPVSSEYTMAWCRSAACIEDELRDLPIPEDK
jgi:uncharacterized small protein (DUF1192 family)